MSNISIKIKVDDEMKLSYDKYKLKESVLNYKFGFQSGDLYA